MKASYADFRRQARESRVGFVVERSEASALAASPEERRREYEKRWSRGGLGFTATYVDLLVNQDANDTAADFCREKIRAAVDDPAVAETLLPKDYPVGTKRMCVDTGYYETFNRDNVTLVDIRRTPIEAITPGGLRTREAAYALDSIVFATGFDAMTGALLSVDIRGRGGRTLNDAWAEGPRTYLGLAVAGFPNLFAITGPGSPSVLSNMIVSIEQHVDWIADCLDRMRAQRSGDDRGHGRRARGVGRPRQRDRPRHALSARQFLVHGRQHSGQAARLHALHRRSRRLSPDLRRRRRQGVRRVHLESRVAAELRMEFHVTPAQRELQHRARCLAADFATRAAQHDREASDPVENYAALRDAGFYGLNVPAELGGGGVGLLGWSLAAEELAQGCASTALSFNMHLSVVGPMMESPLVPRATKERLAKMVVQEGKLIGGNFSEPTTSGLVGTPVPLTRARRVDGGYRITGKKAFASMIAVADHVMVLARPDDAASNAAAMFLLVPPDAPGRRVDLVWDTLGMRATRSDFMTLEECFVPDEALLHRTEDLLPFRRDGANWFWGSYTPVYLGIGVAAYRAISETVKGRTPPGFTQPLAFHPDVRRQVGEMSVDLEAARLLTLYAAWLSDTQGPTPATLSALYRAKYFVGEAVTRVTRTAMTLGGAHALFKASPLERFFRDGAVAPVQFPPRDFCLSTLGMFELGLDPADVLPPLKSDRPDTGPVVR